MVLSEARQPYLQPGRWFVGVWTQDSLDPDNSTNTVCVEDVCLKQ
jgi:hypothetical protein